MLCLEMLVCLFGRVDDPLLLELLAFDLQNQPVHTRLFFNKRKDFLFVVRYLFFRKRVAYFQSYAFILFASAFGILD